LFIVNSGIILGVKRRKYVLGAVLGFVETGQEARAALKLLESVSELDSIVLECLAERTLADGYKKMMLGGEGYDPRSLSIYILSVFIFLFLKKVSCGGQMHLSP
jgi:hypothetical protein